MEAWNFEGQIHLRIWRLSLLEQSRERNVLMLRTVFVWPAQGTDVLHGLGIPQLGTKANKGFEPFYKTAVQDLHAGVRFGGLLEALAAFANHRTTVGCCPTHVLTVC